MRNEALAHEGPHTACAGLLPTNDLASQLGEDLEAHSVLLPLAVHEAQRAAQLQSARRRRGAHACGVGYFRCALRISSTRLRISSSVGFSRSIQAFRSSNACLSVLPEGGFGVVG